jgi:hypothetical protein
MHDTLDETGRIGGCPKIQGMTGRQFPKGKLLKPRADGWIRIRGHAIALLAAYTRAPFQKPALAPALIETFAL